MGIFLAAFGIPHIGKHRQHIGFILLIQIKGLLIIMGDQYLGPAPHFQQAVFFVNGFIHHRLGLKNNLLVEHG